MREYVPDYNDKQTYNFQYKPIFFHASKATVYNIGPTIQGSCLFYVLKNQRFLGQKIKDFHVLNKVASLQLREKTSLMNHPCGFIEDHLNHVAKLVYS